MHDWRLEEQNSPSIKELQTFLVHTCSGWISPILSFLREGRLPPNPEEAKKIQKRATRFTILNDELYKRGSWRQATSSRRCNKTQSILWRSVTIAKGTKMFNKSPEKRWRKFARLGHSHNRGWTSWVLYHREKDKWSSYSSQLTTSQSGSKRKPLQQSQKQRYKILYGKILFAGSGYPGRSYQITIVSSTTRDSDHFARAWA